MEDYPAVSIIIPTWNGEQWLEQLLIMLKRQTLVPKEILIIDSGSTDGTCEIACSYNARLVRISQEEFDHGETRTMAAGLTSGEIIIYMTQDAVPATRDALKLLVQPFLGNEKVAAAYGRQLANSEATVFSKHLRLFNYPDQSEVRCWKDRHLYGFKTVFISNSFAAWRRDVLAGHGFFPERQLFGEDTCALANLLENGYCVAYVSEARVYHSHNYSPVQDFRRYFDIGVFHACHREMLEKFGSPTGAGKKFVRSEIAYLRQRKKYLRLPESIFRSGAKLVAYQLGKRYKRLPKSLPPFLSLHRRWWS